MFCTVFEFVRMQLDVTEISFNVGWVQVLCISSETLRYRQKTIIQGLTCFNFSVWGTIMTTDTKTLIFKSTLVDDRSSFIIQIDVVFLPEDLFFHKFLNIFQAFFVNMDVVTRNVPGLNVLRQAPVLPVCTYRQLQ